jgi:ribonuclease P protein component
VRNRVRRRLRAISAALAETGRLPAGDYLIGVAPAASDASYDELKEMVEKAVTVLSKDTA